MTKGQDGSTPRLLPLLLEAGVIGDLTDYELLQRFTSRNGVAAEMAFAALVQRHGSVVLRTGRALVRDEHDAQDVFQATFLVLALKASRLRETGSLGPWLHAVVLRVASCARSAAARRRRHERAAAERAVLSADDPAPSDWEAVLHEEVGRLPDRYRRPVVLCDLEGVTGEQAARHLGWPVGTVRSRLARGRERLRVRLTRRGLAPAAGSTSAALTTGAAQAAIPDALATSTVRIATRLATDKMATGTVSASLVELMRGGMRTMLLTGSPITVTAVLLVGIVATSVGLYAQQSEPAKLVQKQPEQALHEGGAASARRASDAHQSATALAKTRLTLARESYGDVIETLKGPPGKSEGLSADEFMDRVAAWSRRWMEAECDVTSNRSDQIAAQEAHWKRLKKWEEEFAPHAGIEVSRRAFNTLKFHRLEAEYRLAKMRSQR